LHILSCAQMHTVLLLLPKFYYRILLHKAQSSSILHCHPSLQLQCLEERYEMNRIISMRSSRGYDVPCFQFPVIIHKDHMIQTGNSLYHMRDFNTCIYACPIACGKVHHTKYVCMNGHVHACPDSRLARLINDGSYVIEDFSKDVFLIHPEKKKPKPEPQALLLFCSRTAVYSEKWQSCYLYVFSEIFMTDLINTLVERYPYRFGWLDQLLQPVGQG
jgi:hypothetical protein